ncbi:glycogen/starch/alpha-glucan phosphorylase [Rhodohalobacter sp.]|uniref:glycogen/starch/alpha-glucan phosphorylase n=1 Tax=Rhodohalobacter sp. TaxID=1974210 RepID=UPI002ACE0FC7|nr:glycogen/starch/alpha-glucan phosphorylase [Rhodohalobacter sp.]MDZ7755752.1 glycogen/starch/alpha-glucan phosphorylase [Rhodohalobacter sp.]
MGKSKNIDPRAGMDVDSFKEDIKQHLRYTLSKDKYSSTEWDNYRSVVLSVMDRLHDRWLNTQQRYYDDDKKRVYYISMEYLIGRLLDNMLVNLGMQDVAAEAMKEVGLDYDKVRSAEWDAGLGNGGLGRLAACFLDSMATLGIPAIGYGIRYDYGIFYQQIENGYQVEKPDLWLRYGNPWDIVRPKIQYNVPFYGNSHAYHDDSGDLRFRWDNTHDVLAVAYDTPIPGYKNDVVNNLRLWKASSSSSIDLKSFNQGQYIDAVRDTQLNENISRVLYPNDKIFVGQELRLKQEFFLVSASVGDILRRFKKTNDDWRKLPDKVAIQCNDTHPNLAIPELMRILVDEEGLNWDLAWDITKKTMAYTNHTLLPEALEKWPVSLLRSLLPRHLQIIYEINRRFLSEISDQIGDDKSKISRLSIIGEGEDPVVHMASLGIVGSHKVNGVAELHSNLIKKYLFKDFYEIYPDKFTNKTNGITPRRWLRQANRELANLITGEIGEDWVTDLDQLKKLEKFVDDKKFLKKFAEVKQNNKQRMADYIEEKRGIEVNTQSMFDIQIKRIHEYKRQFMLTLYAITQYNRIKENPDGDFVPRTILVAGKAAPGYTMAKLFIKLMNDVGKKINNDSDVGDKLKFIFLENYSVTLAEKMIPSANLSEQISTAGFEASGTGNMKFALNGALTIGTLDGANVEIKEEVGDENIFIFGNTVDDVEKLRHEGYNPWDYYNSNDELKKALDQIKDGFFNDDEELYQPIIDSLLHKGDYFLVLADYEAFVNKQAEVDKLYKDQDEWNRKALLNTARVGKFSSDRTIKDYADEIWDVEVKK